MLYLNPLLNADSYKLSHHSFYPEGLTELYSNLTPRFDHYFKERYPDFDGQYVVFGTSYMIKNIVSSFNIFFNSYKEKVFDELKTVLTPYIGINDYKRFEDLYDLGYLPIEFKGLPEGSLVPMNIPCLTIRNTHPEFAWLTNYLESWISNELWKPLTVATVARQFKLLSQKYSEETCDDDEHVKFQNHDFSQRGQANMTSSAICGAAWLTNSIGTDNIPSIEVINQYYRGKETPCIGLSIPATEHSCATMGILTADSSDLGAGELAFLKDVLTNKYPSGFVSYVADSYDYWSVISNTLRECRPEIMNRPGRLVIRPDSGDPVKVVVGDFVFVDIDPKQCDGSEESLKSYIEEWLEIDLCNATPHGECGGITHAGYFKYKDKYYLGVVTNFQWNRYDKQYYYLDKLDPYNTKVTEVELTVEQKGTVETLDEIFGSTTNSKGYKVLDPHIGVIYGDGITYHRAKAILEGLKSKGYAASNIVFGIGSYSLNLLSRDDLGTAIKATHAVINGVNIPLHKDPKTDSSKKSARGYLKVVTQDNIFVLQDNVSFEDTESDDNQMVTMFKDGLVTYNPSLEEIRTLLQ